MTHGWETIEIKLAVTVMIHFSDFFIKARGSVSDCVYFHIILIKIICSKCIKTVFGKRCRLSNRSRCLSSKRLKTFETSTIGTKWYPPSRGRPRSVRMRSKLKSMRPLPNRVIQKLQKCPRRLPRTRSTRVLAKPSETPQPRYSKVWSTLRAPFSCHPPRPKRISRRWTLRFCAFRPTVCMRFIIAPPPSWAHGSPIRISSDGFIGRRDRSPRRTPGCGSRIRRCARIVPSPAPALAPPAALWPRKLLV